MTVFPQKMNRSGMTLMEVVVALGIIAFAIPIVLSATGAATGTRQSAESDTRSAWLAKDVQREMLLHWSSDPNESNLSVLSTSFPFPTSGTSSSILIYKNDGIFIQEGSAADEAAASQIPEAAFVVSITAEPYASSISTLSGLAQVEIVITHPAKAIPSKRSRFRYQLLTTSEGT